VDDSGGALEELWNHMEAAQEVVFHIQPFPESGLYRLQLKGFVLGLIFTVPKFLHLQGLWKPVGIPYNI
jgi:hypothetical protein